MYDCTIVNAYVYVLLSIVLLSFQSCCAHRNSTSNSSVPVECPLCEPCYDAWKDTIVKSLKASGSLGIIFSITQVWSVCLCVCNVCRASVLAHQAPTVYNKWN